MLWKIELITKQLKERKILEEKAITEMDLLFDSLNYHAKNWFTNNYLNSNYRLALKENPNPNYPFNDWMLFDSGFAKSLDILKNEYVEHQKRLAYHLIPEIMEKMAINPCPLCRCPTIIVKEDCGEKGMRDFPECQNPRCINYPIRKN